MVGGAGRIRRHTIIGAPVYSVDGVNVEYRCFFVYARYNDSHVVVPVEYLSVVDPGDV